MLIQVAFTSINYLNDQPSDITIGLSTQFNIELNVMKYVTVLALVLLSVCLKNVLQLLLYLVCLYVAGFVMAVCPHACMQQINNQ
jgi:hypothetical protein